ncbi:hypothetical protein HDU76_013012, partial [Blyttiomyces sp. JEL0837]
MKYRYRWATSKERLLRVMDKVKELDLERNQRSKALMKMLKIKHPLQLAVLVRFAWREPTPENIELAETVYQQGIEVFASEEEDIRMIRSQSNKKKKKPINGAAFLCMQYGVFLQQLKNDLTLSQMYYKRASRLSPPPAVQFMIYQAEQERKERHLADEKGGRVKMDLVDRVELRQLLKTLALGTANDASLAKIISRLERAETDAERQYAEFLDLTVRVEEAEEIRADLRELMEELGIDVKESKQGDSDGASSIGVLSYLKRDAFGNLPNLPPAISRSKKETRAHFVYAKIIGEVQAAYKNNFRNQLAVACFILLCVITSEMISTELISENLAATVDQVRTAGNMTLWISQMQLKASANDLTAFYEARDDLTMVNKMLEKGLWSLFYNGMNVMDWQFTMVPITVRRFLGLDVNPVFLPANTSLYDATTEILLHSRLMTTYTPEYFQLNFSGTTIPLYQTSSDFHSCLANPLADLAVTYSDMTDQLAQLNDREIRDSMIMFGVVEAIGAIIMLCLGFFLFWPTVRYIQKQRKLAIQAFQQIPQDTCVNMFLQYRFEKKIQNDDDDEADDNKSMSDDGNDSDEDDEDGDAGVLDTFIEYRDSLLYGNWSLNLPPAKLTADEREYFYSLKYINNMFSLDDLSNQLVEDTLQLLSEPTITSSDQHYVRLFRNNPHVVEGYSSFATKSRDTFESYQNFLNLEIPELDTFSKTNEEKQFAEMVAQRDAQTGMSMQYGARKRSFSAPVAQVPIDDDERSPRSSTTASTGSSSARSSTASKSLTNLAKAVTKEPMPSIKKTESPTAANPDNVFSDDYQMSPIPAGFGHLRDSLTKLHSSHQELSQIDTGYVSGDQDEMSPRVNDVEPEASPNTEEDQEKKPSPREITPLPPPTIEMKSILRSSETAGLSSLKPRIALDPTSPSTGNLSNKVRQKSVSFSRLDVGLPQIGTSDASLHKALPSQLRAPPPSPAQLQPITQPPLSSGEPPISQQAGMTVLINTPTGRALKLEAPPNDENPALRVNSARRPNLEGSGSPTSQPKAITMSFATLFKFSFTFLRVNDVNDAPKFDK